MAGMYGISARGSDGAMQGGSEPLLLPLPPGSPRCSGPDAAANAAEVCSSRALRKGLQAGAWWGVASSMWHTAGGAARYQASIGAQEGPSHAGAALLPALPHLRCGTLG